MILRNVATYSQPGSEFRGLEKINFIYGSNGSGKTTISEVIRNPDNHWGCSIEWHGTPYKSMVYNRNFIKENFRDDSRVKGIFTLGKESADLIVEIEQRKIAIHKYDNEIDRLEGFLKIKLDEQSENINKFKEHCWQLKTKYDSEFKEAFEGYRNSKDRFMDKCKQESLNNTKVALPIELLRKRKESVFSNQLQQIDLLKTIIFEDVFLTIYFLLQRL